MNLKKLARLAQCRQLEEERARRETLNLLRDIDPEVVERAVYVFHDKTDAANWLTSPVITLGGITPLQALAAGRREDVLRVLNEIFYGLPS